MKWKGNLSVLAGLVGVTLLPFGFVVLDVLDRTCSSATMRWMLAFSAMAFFGNLAFLLLIPVLFSGEGPGSHWPRVLGFLGTLGFAAVLGIGAPRLVARHEEAARSTVADLRALGTALDGFLADHGSFPVAEGRKGPGEASGLASWLSPTWIDRVPTTDGWGNPIQISLAEREYLLISFGKCGEPDNPSLHYPDESGHSILKRDIVFSAGRFVQCPPGLERP